MFHKNISIIILSLINKYKNSEIYVTYPLMMACLNRLIDFFRKYAGFNFVELSTTVNAEVYTCTNAKASFAPSNR